MARGSLSQGQESARLACEAIGYWAKSVLRLPSGEIRDFPADLSQAKELIRAGARVELMRVRP